MANGEGFWGDLSAGKVLKSGVDIFLGVKQAEAAEYEAQTRRYEDKQRARVEAAKLDQQKAEAAAKLARDTFNNEQMWKIASWFTMASATALVGAVVLKIFKVK